MRPLTIKSAGGRARPPLIDHVGRTSGSSYSTPVGAVPIEDGFVIALPYGLSADWLKNVLERQLSHAHQRAHRLFG